MKDPFSGYHVRGGFLVREEPARSRARTLDGFRRPFSPDDDIPGEQPNSWEDDEEQEGGAGEAVARYPASRYTITTEDVGGEAHHVVYRSDGEGRAPAHKTDVYEMSDSRSRARDVHPRPPQTLAELNALHAARYGAKEGRR